jgi:flagellar biosynthesis anti-sigma factor FlgM
MTINNPGNAGGPAGLPGGDNNISNAAKANRSASLERLGHRGGYSQASEPSSGGQDEVSISPLAQAVQSLRSDSPSRQARLDAIAKQVESGSYRVDATTLSRSLIQNAISQNEPGPAASGGTDGSS